MFLCQANEYFRVERGADSGGCRIHHTLSFIHGPSLRKKYWYIYHKKKEIGQQSDSSHPLVSSSSHRIFRLPPLSLTAPSDRLVPYLCVSRRSFFLRHPDPEPIKQPSTCGVGEQTTAIVVTNLLGSKSSVEEAECERRPEVDGEP